MRRSVVVVAVFALAVLGVVPTVAADNPQLNFRTHLTGDQGIVRFSADGSSVTYKLNVANIENVTMAHIHVADAPGENGPPVLWLYPDGPPLVLIDGRVQGTLGAGTATASDLVGPLAGLDLDDLRAAIVEGRAYINVHTLQYPPGEIRGQL